MKLALEEVNETGVLGRTIEIVQRDDQQSVRRARLVARRFAENSDMVAVIGHLQSFTTRPAAQIYDDANLLHLVPSATANGLTSEDRPLLYRLTFDNRSVGHKLADFAHDQGYERIAVRYVSNQYGLQLANAFEKRAVQHDVTVTSRKSYDATLKDNPKSIPRVFHGMKDSDLDAVFLVGEVPLAGRIISRMREGGIEAQIIGSGAMGVTGLYREGGSSVEGTVTPYRFNSNEDRERVQEFREAFQKKYDVEPDAGSAAAYDAVRILAQAIREVNSTTPKKVAAALQSMKDVSGSAGPYTFDETGDLTARGIRLQVVRDGEFVPLDSTTFAQWSQQH
jgi:branched-chain amino acid transport system substrate-binding protein